jgi:hypothetical protein
LLAVTSAVALYALHYMYRLNETMQLSVEQMNTRMQKLDSQLSFDSRRRKLLLGIRDEILKVNPRVGLHDAYLYAEWITEASEKYPSVDPLMFLAVGIVESGYNPVATSHANAKGLYQIWPATGRLLARALGWEYTDDILYDPKKNTELAALYLDILFTAYNDARMVLAEYNGGPLNAGYLRAGSKHAAAETRDYVPKVLDVYERLRRQFDQGTHVAFDLKHIDQRRDGKRLDPRPGPQPDKAERGVSTAGLP